MCRHCVPSPVPEGSYRHSSPVSVYSLIQRYWILASDVIPAGSRRVALISLVYFLTYFVASGLVPPNVKIETKKFFIFFQRCKKMQTLKSPEIRRFYVSFPSSYPICIQKSWLHLFQIHTISKVFFVSNFLYFHSYLFPLSSNLSLQLLYIYCPKSAFTHFRPQKSLLNHSVVFYTKKMSFLKSIDFHTFYLQLSSTETLTEFPFSLFSQPNKKKIYFM